MTTTAAKAADQAAEAMRALNYLTLPREGAPGLEYPGDVYEVVASLKILAQRLPQLFGQLSLWLGEQHAAGKVGHDSGEDAAEHVRQVRYWLDTAETCAHELAGALDKVHNASAGLKAAG